ncbi:MAG TPA: hypothetical protein VK738_11490 [Terriglobales bacterium]|jgi:hypothetical protein|nr:hypothetical protein [Terriglobales bacterium]
MKLKLLIVLTLVLSANMGFAQTTTCTAPLYLPATGIHIQNFLSGASITYWYAVFGYAGHSYSLETKAPQLTDTGIYVAATTVYNSTDTPCTTPLTDTLTVNGNTFSDPLLSGFSDRRRTWIAPATGIYVVGITTGTTGNILLDLHVLDTTYYNPRWSTFTGFLTQWGFKNTSDQALSCTLTANDTLGAPPNPPATISFTIPAGKSVFKIIGNGAGYDINSGPQHGGDAVLACDAPPNTIKADAYFINGSGSVIVPSSFEPRRADF